MLVSCSRCASILMMSSPSSRVVVLNALANNCSAIVKEREHYSSMLCLDLRDEPILILLGDSVAACFEPYI
jgi:hypothetical protein